MTNDDALQSQPLTVSKNVCAPGASLERVAGKPRWTVVLAFYNEAAEIEATLQKLCLQSAPFRLVLVDNGSTDGSADICRKALFGSGIDYVMLRQDLIAGQTAALSLGLDVVVTELVATCDADTFYPSDYLRNAEALLDAGGERTVAACAYYLPKNCGFLHQITTAFHQVGISRLLPRQAHVGAAGQCFRTDALRRAGGYCHVRWPYLLGDHEIMHRVLKQGGQAMSLSHWCSPSGRRAFPLRWSLTERILYHVVPFPAKDRYFRWLGRRFERRRLFAARLRERTWEMGS